jgi:hypothetical protein
MGAGADVVVQAESRPIVAVETEAVTKALLERMIEVFMAIAEFSRDKR